MDFKKIKNKFEELYDVSPLLVRSPGRINLIGEHTDYNDGFDYRLFSSHTDSTSKL